MKMKKSIVLISTLLFGINAFASMEMKETFYNKDNIRIYAQTDSHCNGVSIFVKDQYMINTVLTYCLEDDDVKEIIKALHDPNETSKSWGKQGLKY